ncbi:putative dsRNA-binding protein [Rivularia sp. UHCC 0363]|uniref:putative dsRNA-binding protein n=1 Tax=Rivularia sp. UHCC 0363 TaxID=3110244 RepID=UPI002B1FECDB|nr:putative dsRNA-binding protein [Rivularia sp. UHCC 0363]MEA5593157.1 putative dsRNA-binding protein [Rivularia sp. UHCC 0363]
MNENAINKLLELFKNLGYLENDVKFEFKSACPALHYCTVKIKINGRTFEANGVGRSKTDAKIAAAETLLKELQNHPELVINWEEINVDAQRGDALIKLAVYLCAEWQSADDKSKKLQNLEADSHLVKVFDQWKSNGDRDLAIWGGHLSVKRKATLVEALLWQRFRMQVMTANAPTQLESLLKILRS